MRNSIMRAKKTLLLLFLAGHSALFASPKETNTASQARTVLQGILNEKTLVLATSPEFISYDEQPSGDYSYLKMSVKTSEMLREFGLKTRISQKNRPDTIVQAAADKDHLTVIVRTVDGYPYGIMTDHFFVQCDPLFPGGLFYSDKGTGHWGYYQQYDPKNMALEKRATTFHLTFLPMETTPTAFFEANHLVEGFLKAATSLGYDQSNRTVTLHTEKAKLDIKTLEDDTEDPFGIQMMNLSMSNATFCFSDFIFGQAVQRELVNLTKHDLDTTGLPLREPNKGEEFSPLIPPGFPSSPEEKAASDKLRELIDSLAKNDKSTPGSAGHAIPGNSARQSH